MGFASQLRLNHSTLLQRHSQPLTICPPAVVRWVASWLTVAPSSSLGDFSFYFVFLTSFKFNVTVSIFIIPRGDII